MYAPIALIAIVAAASAFPSSIPHECMEEVRQKYSQHLALSPAEAQDHSAIMKKLMELIDFTKCMNVQFRIDMRDSNKSESHDQNVSNTSSRPPSSRSEENDDYYKIEYTKDKLKEDKDEIDLKVKYHEDHEADSRRTKNNKNFYQTDRGIEKAKQSYSTTEKNNQYNKAYDMDVELTDGNSKYHEDSDDKDDNYENVKQFYERQNINYRNGRQPYVSRRRSKSNFYRQLDGLQGGYYTRRQPKYNKGVNYNNYRQPYYHQRESNANYYDSGQPNITFGRPDIAQETKDKLINNEKSGDDPLYDDFYESKEIIEDKLEIEKTNLRNDEFTNKYGGLQKKADNIYNENYTVRQNYQTAYSVEDISNEYNTSKTDFTYSKTIIDQITGRSVKQDEVHGNNYHEKHIGTDNHDIDDEKRSQSNIKYYNTDMQPKYNRGESINYYYNRNSQDNQREQNANYFDSSQLSTSYDKSVIKKYNNNKRKRMDIIQVPKDKFINKGESGDDKWYDDSYESEEVTEDIIEIEKPNVRNDEVRNKYVSQQNNADNTNIDNDNSKGQGNQTSYYDEDINSEYSTTNTDYNNQKVMIDQARNKYSIVQVYKNSQDEVYGNHHHEKPIGTDFHAIDNEKRSQVASYSKSKDVKIGSNENSTEKIIHSIAENTEKIDYIEKNKNFFSDQTKEISSDEVQKRLTLFDKPLNSDAIKKIYSQKPDATVSKQNQYHSKTEITLNSDKLKKGNQNPDNINDKSNNFDTTTKHGTDQTELISTESKDYTTLSERKQDKTADVHTETANLGHVAKNNVLVSDHTEILDLDGLKNANIHSRETKLQNSEQTESNIVPIQKNENDQTYVSNKFSTQFLLNNNPILFELENPNENGVLDIVIKFLNTITKWIS